MMTWREIQEHPERMTDEDRKAVIDSFMLIKELGKATAAYNVKMPISEITPQLVASNFYQEHLIIAAIFEAFIEQEQITFTELNQSMVDRLPTDFVCELPDAYRLSLIAKMIRLGYLNAIDTGDKYMPNFRITKDGITVLKNQTFQSLAATSFFGKQTFDFNEQTNGFNKEVAEFNKRTSKMNVMMLIVTVFVAIMTTIQIWIAVCK